MSSLSLMAKKAYFAKVRRANYAASLRLEGFDVPERGLKPRFSSREEAIRFYLQHR